MNTEDKNMTDFVDFSQTRKQLIAFQRERLLTERPTRDQYGTVHKALDILDYAVYAALRGADYRKGDQSGGKVAAHRLQTLTRNITYWATSPSLRGQQFRVRFVPEGLEPASEVLMELKSIIEEELDKWK